MKLVIEDSAGTRSTVTFTGDEITVGRAADGNSVRLGERNVSRRHARFLRQGNAVSVEDLGSLVGTRVNGERIQGRRRLRPGDVVEIGDFDVAVLADASEEEGAPPPLPAPAVTPSRPSDPGGKGAGRATVKTPLAEPAPIVHAPRVDVARTVRLSAAAGVVALLLGLAAGFALGSRMAPPAPAAAPASR